MQKNLNYRSTSVSVRAPSTLDDDARSLEFVITTEAPVRMYDWDSGEVVPEVLLAKGGLMPRQVPLLDTHSRFSTADVLGSVRNKKVEGGAVVGTATFSETPRADETFQKYREGHLTDFSAGYVVNDVTRVKKGEKVKLDGRTWKGPVNVVTSWTLREASCCPIGADANAKARSDQPFNEPNYQKREDEEMPFDEEKFNQLEKAVGEIAGAVKTLADAQRKADDDRQKITDTDAEIEKLRQESVLKPEIVKRKEKERIQAIDLLCEKMSATTGVDFDDLRVEMINEGTSEVDANKRVLDRLASAQRVDNSGVRVFVSKDEREKSRDGAVDGLLLRTGIAPDKVKDPDTEFRTMTFLEMAKNRLMVAGQSVRGLDQMKIFERAMTSSDFPNILADVANKAMLMGFEEAEESYSAWCDTSGIANDFRDHIFARASEAPSLVEVNPDGGEYRYAGVSDAKETVAVVDYGIIVPFTRKAMVNDDLGALADIREKLGAASARKYGDLVYAVLTGNPTMGDGNSLFDDTNHSNHVDSGGVPNVAALNVGNQKMATQTDIAGVQNLNIRPVYIIAPWALKGTIDQLVVATSPTAIGTEAAPVTNAWNYLEPVYDARLDTASATAWYLAARRGMTVKLFTLNGNMTPMMEDRPGWTVDGMEFKCRVTAAAKAMDWRGLFLNDGA